MYHIRFWMGAFSFIDATSIDTPIFDPEVRKLVFELAVSFETADRYRKSVAFLSYLEAQWHLSNIAAPYFDFVTLIRSQEDSFIKVSRFIEHYSAAIRVGTS